ncbi:SPOR domain-containing protein [Candidatus Poribacteria bacterium]
MRTRNWNSRLTIPIVIWICLLALAYLLIFQDHGSSATQDSEPSSEPLDVEAANSSSKENDLYEDCKRDYIAGKMTEVCAKAKYFLGMFPGSQHGPEMIFMQAASELLIDKAIRKYELMIAGSPESDWANKAHIELGRRFQLLSEYDKALTRYQHVDPSMQNDEIRYLAARCLLLKEEHEAGMALIRSISDMNRDARTLCSADSYFAKHEYDEAKALYEWIMQSFPDSTSSISAHLQLCRILEQTNGVEAAQQSYEMIVTKYPYTPEAQLARFHLQNLPKYAIQLGAFSQKQNALSLVNQLKAIGYDAYVATSAGTDKSLHKVRIGRFSSRNAAEKVALELTKRTGFSAMIMKASD